MSAIARLQWSSVAVADPLSARVEYRVIHRPGFAPPAALETRSAKRRSARRALVALAVTSASWFCAISCLPSARSGQGATGVTGDHLYTGVLAGSGGPSSSGTLQALYMDPGNAEAVPSGPARSKAAEMVAKIQLGTVSAVLRGQVSNGQAKLGGGGWAMILQILSDGSLQGTYSASGDAGAAAGAQGNLAAVDDSDGSAKTLCGTYDGSGSGTWNFVIAGSGSVAGSFYGAADGNITGSVGGDGVSINWSGDAFGPIAGTASGSLTADQSSVQGTWQSSDNSLSGTFTSDTFTCGTTEPPPQHSSDPPSSGNCPCAQTPLPPGGACCEGGPAGSYCCADFQ